MVLRFRGLTWDIRAKPIAMGAPPCGLGSGWRKQARPGLGGTRYYGANATGIPVAERPHVMTGGRDM